MLIKTEDVLGNHCRLLIHHLNAIAANTRRYRMHRTPNESRHSSERKLNVIADSDARVPEINRTYDDRELLHGHSARAEIELIYENFMLRACVCVLSPSPARAIRHHMHHRRH